MLLAIQIILTVGVPLLIYRFQNTKLISFIGPIAMTYLCGIIFALLIYLLNLGGANLVLDKTIGEDGSFIIIALAIPLLLFSSNIKEVKKLSKKTIMSWVSLIVSVIIATTVFYYAFGRNLEYGAELSAMGVGLYTGGTPNLNAIGEILKVPSRIIGYANLSDMIFGGIFYLFLLSIAKPLLSKILTGEKEESYLTEDIELENFEEVKIGKAGLKGYRGLIFTFLLSLACCGVSAGIGFLLGKAYLVPVLMFGATIGGIGFSFVKKVAETKGNYRLGQYFILVFSFAISSILDFSMISKEIINIFLLFMFFTLGTLVIHTIISKILGLDVDVTITTLVAGVYSPAFVPAITKQIGNEKLTAPGLICGSIGYAMGTFLGYLLYFTFV